MSSLSGGLNMMEDSPGGRGETETVCQRQRAIVCKLTSLFDSESTDGLSVFAEDVQIHTGLPFLPIVSGKRELQRLVEAVQSSFSGIDFTLDEFTCSEATNLFATKVTFSGRVKGRKVLGHELPASVEEGKMVCFSAALHCRADERDNLIKRADLYLEAFSLKQLGLELDKLCTGPACGQPTQHARAAGK